MSQQHAASHNNAFARLTRQLSVSIGLFCIVLPLQTASSNALPNTLPTTNTTYANTTSTDVTPTSTNATPTPTSTTTAKDDSELIIDRIKESLAAVGLISVEQHTGRLLFNPKVDKLHSMALKQKFLLPAMVVNQTVGLKLISEMPFSCFMVSAGELSEDNFKGYRQHETLSYIRDVKNFPVSRALICEPIGAAAKDWRRYLALNADADPFVFEEHISLTGEHFYYFLNTDGSFEMYL